MMSSLMLTLRVNKLGLKSKLSEMMLSSINETNAVFLRCSFFRLVTFMPKTKVRYGGNVFAMNLCCILVVWLSSTRSPYLSVHGFPVKKLIQVHSKVYWLMFVIGSYDASRSYITPVTLKSWFAPTVVFPFCIRTLYPFLAKLIS
jgi:hypothetical protein